MDGAAAATEAIRARIVGDGDAAALHQALHEVEREERATSISHVSGGAEVYGRGQMRSRAIALEGRAAGPDAALLTIGEAERLYDTILPTLTDWGLDLHALNRELVDGAFAEVLEPLASLGPRVADGITSGTHILQAIPKAKAALYAGAETFRSEVDVGNFTEVLPAKLRALLAALLAGVNNPALLAPKLACFGVTLDEGGSGDVRVGSDSQSRSAQWIKLQTRFADVASSLEPSLASISSVATLLNATVSSFEVLPGVLDDIDYVVQVEKEIKNQISQIALRIAPGSSDRGDCSNRYAQPMVTIKKLLESTREVRELCVGLTVATQRIERSSASLNAVCATAQSLLDQLSRLDITKIVDQLGRLQESYPPLLRDAHQLLVPGGLLGCILVPSPYLNEIQLALAEVEQVGDLRRISELLSSSLNGILGGFGLSMVSLSTRGVSANENSSSLKAIGSAWSNMHHDLIALREVVEDIREMTVERPAWSDRIARRTEVAIRKSLDMCKEAMRDVLANVGASVATSAHALVGQ